MKEKQITKRDFGFPEPSFNGNGSVSHKIINKSQDRKPYTKILRKKPARVKAVSKAAKLEMEEALPAGILKTCRDLELICIKIKMLEKEKQKLINTILKYVPKFEF